MEGAARRQASGPTKPTTGSAGILPASGSRTRCVFRTRRGVDRAYRWEETSEWARDDDTDDSGELDVADAIATFNYLFQGAVPPPAPGPPDCGADPTPDGLHCNVEGGCSGDAE